MSNSSSPPCSKHPSQQAPLVGVCASCLREKLAAFVGSEEREGSSPPPTVSKSIAIGSYSYMHDPAPDQQMGSSAPAAANELHAAAMETCTSPQGGFSQITRSSSFDEKLARLSPISSIKQRPLSYYFDLHNNNEGVSTIHNIHHKTTKSSNRVEPQYSSPLYAPCNAAAAHGRNDPEREHGSFSAAVRGHRSPLLDVGESGAPFSWLSALFSKRREKQKARSKQTLASWRGCSSGGGRGFNEGAYGNSSSLSWEAPRPSSWEQLSSWEKPWELPSLLYNAEPTRASDADLHDYYNPTIASQSQINQRIGHGFAVEKKQGRLHWNKVWIKALLTNKWAIKLKSGLIKKRQQAGMDSDGDDDEASTMSEAASVARESNQYRHHSQNHYSVQNHSSMQQYAMQNRQIKACQDGARHSQQREIGSNRRGGYGGWGSYYSTSVDGLKARQRYKSNSALLRGESGDIMSKHNGLLKLYLTPVRGITSRAKSKQWGSRADFFNP